MGFWSSLGSAISSVVSSAVSAVSSTLGSVAGSIGSLATGVLKVAAPYIGAIVQIVQIIGQLTGVLRPDDDTEELGEKAMQADKKPEDFNTNAEYIEYLRNEVELDKEKFENASDSEKLARRAVGATIVAKGIEEKKGFDIPYETWIAMAKLGMQNKPEEANKILDTFKDEKLEDFAKYVDDKLDAQKEEKIGDKLVEMYKELEPNATESEIEDKVMKMQVGDKND